MLGPELSLTSVTRTSRMPGPVAARRWRGDTAAIIALLALPVLVYGVPALLGHPVLPGDDLTQNFPLRVLAGHEIRSGHLPLYNPYIWSGAPLLAGWNAGAAYPFTFVFAVIPPVAAWTLNMILTWAIAGIGMFVFLRACRLGCGPAVLGALSFAFAGAMSAQVAHFGLVAGMSWVPVQLLCVLRLTGPRELALPAGLDRGAGRGVWPDDPGRRAEGYRRRRRDRRPLRGLADRPAGTPLRPRGPVGRGRPGPGRLPRRGAVDPWPGHGRHIPAGGEFRGAVQLRLAPAPVAAADAGAGSAGRLRLVRPADVLRQLQPGRSHGLRWGPAAGGRVRLARAGPAAPAPAGVARVARHGRGRGCAGSRGQHPGRGCARPRAAVQRPAAAEPEHPRRGPGAGRAPRVLGRPPGRCGQPAVPPGPRPPRARSGNGSRRRAAARRAHRGRPRPVLGHGTAALDEGWTGRGHPRWGPQAVAGPVHASRGGGHRARDRGPAPAAGAALTLAGRLRGGRPDRVHAAGRGRGRSRPGRPDHPRHRRR